MKVALVFLIGLALGGAGLHYWRAYEATIAAPAPQRQAPRPPRSAASSLGRIQPSEGVISLGVSLPDQLAKLFVAEGQGVKEGTVLAQLASRIDRQMELDLLELQIKEAGQKVKEIDRTGALQHKLDEVHLKQLKEQGPIDISMQKLKVTLLKKQTAQAHEGLERINPLNTVSRQEKEQQEMLVLQSQAELGAAEDMLQKLTLGQALNLEMASAKMELARATQERTRREIPLASLGKQRDMARYRLEQTSLKAPGAGQILKIFARPGELVAAPQPILQMADVSKMAVLAEVYETDIHNIYIGQRATVTSKVENAKKMTGKVVSLGNMIGKNRVYDADPLADVDRRVIEVKIILDQPEMAASLINLQVNVDFLPREQPVQEGVEIEDNSPEPVPGD